MRVLVLAVAGLVFCASGPLKAGEITVLGHPEVESGLAAAAAEFEKETGDKLAIAYLPTPEIRKRLHAGDAIDLVIASAAAIAEFTKFGKVDKEAVRLGQVGAGIAIRPTALVPAIASTEDLRRSIQRCDRLAVGGAGDAMFLESLLKRLKIWPQSEAKIYRFNSGAEAMDYIAGGRGIEMAFGSTIEILKAKSKGVVYVGALPKDLHKGVLYMAAPGAASKQKKPAADLAKFLGGPKGRPHFAAAGIM